MYTSVQVKQLRSLGKDPYAYKYDRTHTAAQLQQQFEGLPSGQIAEDTGLVSIAGRVRARRFMGKLAFATLADDSGEIQLYLEKTALDAAAPDTFKYVCRSYILDGGYSCICTQHALHTFSYSQTL